MVLVRRGSCSSYHTRPRALNAFRASVPVQKLILPHTLSSLEQLNFWGLSRLESQFDFYLASLTLPISGCQSLILSFYSNSVFMNRKS